MSDNHHSPVRGWPASLVAISEIIGIPATLRLVERYGGDGVYVPHHVDPESNFVQVAGLTAAEILVQHYAGEKVPIATLAGVRHKKALIVEASGPAAEVARRFAVTARWVRMCRNSLLPDARQLDMFPLPDAKATDSADGGSGSA